MPSELMAQVKELAKSDIYKWVIESIVVENDDQMKNISDVVIRGKRLIKDATAARMAETKPLKDQAKAIEAEWAPIINQLELATVRAEKALLDYHRKKKEEAEALQIEQMKEQAVRIADGEVARPEAIIDQVSDKVRANMGTVSVVTDYVYTVVDEDAVERSLCSPDPKKIKARHESGVKVIEGVLITTKERTVARGG